MNSTGSLKLLVLRNKAIHTGGTSSNRSLARKMFDGAWIAGNSYLDCLKSGGVIVGEVLEDVSCSKAKGAQAVQDWRLEAWPKGILNDGAFKYEWDQNTPFDLKSQGKTRVPTKVNENIINDKRPPIKHSRYGGALTSHSSEAGVYMEGVPVSTQTVQGRL